MMALGKFAFSAALLFVALTITLADRNEEIKKYAEKGNEIYKKCSAETHLSQELGQHIMSTVMNYDPLPQGEGVKCYIACHLEAAGDMEKDGKINWEHIESVKEKLYSEEDGKKIIQAINTCSQTEMKSGDACERAYHSADCYYGNLKKLNVTPLKVN